MKKTIIKGIEYVKVSDIKKFIQQRRSCRNIIPTSWTLDFLEKEVEKGCH
jgi:hypothetical protein